MAQRGRAGKNTATATRFVEIVELLERERLKGIERIRMSRLEDRSIER
jgi:hypothetical protein